MPTKARSATPPHPTPTFDDRRGSACKRGYGRRWEKLRQLILHRDPICTVRENIGKRLDLGPEILRRLCAGDQPSTQVDHILPKPYGDDSEENLQGACDSCHSIKTRLIDPLIIACSRKGP